ncbi:hypothetical protein BN873_210170 [Candidatus Competibacter denitrificans Run_A_D11]|uniref:Uncharacterized protein n=1 Tax=Candidatus Competibacter denitrificans Run_A_D11 TaxID=1400863 RepID=W6M5Q3_9GAMM|nr:hypothetical protein BN873_210170 [Candidatus Competibacter denitrificans Run_A_D11]
MSAPVGCRCSGLTFLHHEPGRADPGDLRAFSFDTRMKRSRAKKIPSPAIGEKGYIA